MATPEQRQRTIDALISATAFDKLPAEKRLLRLAKIGYTDPAALSADEAKEVFDALILHYAQMGIG